MQVRVDLSCVCRLMGEFAVKNVPGKPLRPFRSSVSTLRIALAVTTGEYGYSLFTLQLHFTTEMQPIVVTTIQPSISRSLSPRLFFVFISSSFLVSDVAPRLHLAVYFFSLLSSSSPTTYSKTYKQNLASHLILQASRSDTHSITRWVSSLSYFDTQR